MARRMETRHCAVCGEPFQAAVEGHRTKCELHKGRTRRAALSTTRKAKKLDPQGRRCTVRVSASGATCGKPAVYAFRSSGSSEEFAECRDHFDPRYH